MCVLSYNKNILLFKMVYDIKQIVSSNAKLDSTYRRMVSKCNWVNLYYGIASQQIRENNFKKVVEVGIGYGVHAKEMLDNTELEHLYLVDPSIPYEGDLFSKDILNNLNGFNNLLKNIYINLENHSHRYTHFRQPSISITNYEIPDNSVDLVFLDGDHSYDAVSKDLPFWYAKLRPGGFLLGDDYASCHPETRKAVDEFVSSNGYFMDLLKKPGNKYPIYKIVKE